MNDSKCEMKFLRQSPYKVRFVLDSIRGKKVAHALNFLDLSNKKASKFISKALKSALSNYSQKNETTDSSVLYVKKAFVDGGPKIKRFRPAAMGRAVPIKKRMSHITVTVGEK